MRFDVLNFVSSIFHNLPEIIITPALIEKQEITCKLLTEELTNYYITRPSNKKVLEQITQKFTAVSHEKKLSGFADNGMWLLLTKSVCENLEFFLADSANKDHFFQLIMMLQAVKNDDLSPSTRVTQLDFLIAQYINPFLTSTKLNNNSVVEVKNHSASNNKEVKSSEPSCQTNSHFFLAVKPDGCRSSGSGNGSHKPATNKGNIFSYGSLTPSEK